MMDILRILRGNQLVRRRLLCPNPKSQEKPTKPEWFEILVSDELDSQILNLLDESDEQAKINSTDNCP